jgi:hypothetical protein
MKATHNFLCRLFFYVLALMFLNTAFGSWPDSSHPAFYLTHYLLPGTLCVAIFECARLVYTLTRRRGLPH